MRGGVVADPHKTWSRARLCSSVCDVRQPPEAALTLPVRSPKQTHRCAASSPRTCRTCCRWPVLARSSHPFQPTLPASQLQPSPYSRQPTRPRLPSRANVLRLAPTVHAACVLKEPLMCVGFAAARVCSVLTSTRCDSPVPLQRHPLPTDRGGSPQHAEIKRQPHPPLVAHLSSGGS